MADAVSDVNAKIAGYFTSFDSSSILTWVGWFIFAVICIAGIWWVINIYNNRKIYSKTITAHSNIGGYWKASYKDTAKITKLGKSGFEILYLKKLKTWKIAYGGNFGDSHYDFYVMPDGYWYNSRQKADVLWMDKNGGLIPVVTTNPLMRGQYTALEKLIDSLHGEKQKFWDKYGNFIMSIAFVVIAGVFLWLNYKEFVTAMGQLGGFIDKLGQLVDKLNVLSSNLQTTTNGGNGLIPVK